MINHSPTKSEATEVKQLLARLNYKRPPLPSIHLTSSKHFNNSGHKYGFLKRNSDRQVIHDTTEKRVRSGER